MEPMSIPSPYDVIPDQRLNSPHPETGYESTAVLSDASLDDEKCSRLARLSADGRVVSAFVQCVVGDQPSVVILAKLENGPLILAGLRETGRKLYL
jgi:hypothetical protein